MSSLFLLRAQPQPAFPTQRTNTACSRRRTLDRLVPFRQGQYCSAQFLPGRTELLLSPQFAGQRDMDTVHPSLPPPGFQLSLECSCPPGTLEYESRAGADSFFQGKDARMKRASPSWATFVRSTIATRDQRCVEGKRVATVPSFLTEGPIDRVVCSQSSAPR